MYDIRQPLGSISCVTNDLTMANSNKIPRRLVKSARMDKDHSPFRLMPPRPVGCEARVILGGEAASARCESFTSAFLCIEASGRPSFEGSQFSLLGRLLLWMDGDDRDSRVGFSVS